MTQTQDDARTPLDLAHAAMQAAPDDDTARLRFYERLADDELFILLTREAEGDSIDPELLEMDGSRFVLVFDREDRLTDFTEGPAPYAALPGRVIAGVLAGQEIGLGVNLGVAPSSILIPAEAMTWLTETLTHAPRQVEARLTAITTPEALPEALIRGLKTKLASAGGLARCACLAGVRYADGRRGHLLGFIDPAPGAEAALAGAAGEALTFSGIEAGQMDVGFFAADDPAGAQLLEQGMRFDLPKPAAREPAAPPAPPGMDPSKPPILK